MQWSPIRSLQCLCVALILFPLPEQGGAQTGAASTQGAGTTSLTADQASFAAIAQRSLRAHPDIQARRAAYEAQGFGVTAAGAPFRPRIDLIANTGQGRSPRVDAAGGTVSETGTSRAATLSLRQPLFDGSEVASETERQARLGNVRFFELRQSEDALLLEMARAWIDVERQRSLIELAEDNLAAHEKLVALVQTRVSAGVGRGADLDQAQSRLSSARLSLSSDMGALGEAAARFQRSALIVPPTRLAPILLPPAALPASEADVLAAAVAASPNLRSAAENNAALDAEVNVRRAAFWPRVALEGRHDLAARTPLMRDAASSSLLLTFNYNLYAGGGDVAREQDTIMRVSAARQQFQDALVSLRQAVATSWAEATRQLAMNRNAQSYAESVARTRDAYRVQFDIGQRSLLDLLNTENELAQARRQEINSRVDAVQAQLRLLALSGRLFSVFGLARNEAQPYRSPVVDPIDSRAFVVNSAADSVSKATALVPAAAASMLPSPSPSPSSISGRPVTVAPAVPPAAIDTVRVERSVREPEVIRSPASTDGSPASGRNLASTLTPSTLFPAPASAAPAAAPAATAVPALPLPVVPVSPAPAPAADTGSAGHRVDYVDRRNLVVARFGPTAQIRLPEALHQAFASWVAAVESANVGRQLAAYLAADVRPTTWDRSDGGRPNTASRLRLIQTDQVDDDRTFAGSSAQIAILALVNDGPGNVRCIRSAQVWRKLSSGDAAAWRIARERAISLPVSQCAG